MQGAKYYSYKGWSPFLLFHYTVKFTPGHGVKVYCCKGWSPFLLFQYGVRFTPEHGVKVYSLKGEHLFTLSIRSKFYSTWKSLLFRVCLLYSTVFYSENILNICAKNCSTIISRGNTRINSNILRQNRSILLSRRYNYLLWQFLCIDYYSNRLPWAGVQNITIFKKYRFTTVGLTTDNYICTRIYQIVV